MRKSTLFVIVASVIYGVLPCLTKIATTMVNPQTFILVGHSAGVVIVGFILRAQRQRVWLGWKLAAKVILAAGIPFVGTTLLLTAAYQLIAAGVSTMIHFIYPVFVMVTMMIFFHEPVSGRKILASGAALLGLLFIVTGSGAAGGSNRLIGMLCALASGVTYGSYVIANEKSFVAKLNVFVLLFYMLAFSTAVMAAVTVVTGGVAVCESPMPYILALVNQVGNISAIVLFALGVRSVGASTGAIVNMLEPAVGMLASTLVFRDPLSVSMVLGCALVMSSIFLVAKTKGKQREV